MKGIFLYKDKLVDDEKVSVWYVSGRQAVNTAQTSAPEAQEVS